MGAVKPTAGPTTPTQPSGPRPSSSPRPAPATPVAPPLRHRPRRHFRRPSSRARARPQGNGGITKARGRDRQPRPIVAAAAAATTTTTTGAGTAATGKTEALVQALWTRAVTAATPATKGALAAHGEDTPGAGSLLPSPSLHPAGSPFPADTPSVAQRRKQQQRHDYDALAVSFRDLGVDDEDKMDLD